MAHNAATPNQSITVQLRYEDQHRGSERFPCYYESYTLTEDEAATMVESDLRIRRESSDDPDSVQPRPVDLIFQDLGKGEYNQARRFYRNTSAVAVDTTDTPPQADKNGGGRGRSVRAGQGAPMVAHATGTNRDPGPDWDECLAIREALDALGRRERFVLFALYEQGYTQREVATVLGVSQPMVARLADRARKKLALALGMGVIK